MSKYARYVSMSGLSCMPHDPNILLASKRFFFRCFAHGLVKPIGNSTKWTQSAVKRKAFEHGAKSMVTESAIGVIEIARCLFSKQAKTAGPQWTTLPCHWVPRLIIEPTLLGCSSNMFKRQVGSIWQEEKYHHRPHIYIIIYIYIIWCSMVNFQFG